MRLLYKHVIKDFLSKRTIIILLSLFLISLAFLHFFVHFSIDYNLIKLSRHHHFLTNNENKYLLALENNRFLVRSIDCIIVSICSLIIWLVIRRTVTKNRMTFAQLMSMGFSMSDMALIYTTIVFVISIVCSFIGLIAGYISSDLLIKSNTQTYLVEGLEKGINLGTFLIGTLGTSAVFTVLTYLAAMSVKHDDIAIMMRGANLYTIPKGLVEKLVQLLPFKNKFYLKLALRNLSSLGLLIVE